MSQQQRGESDERVRDFTAATEGQAPGFLAEFWEFLKHNKKWWLLPILVVLVLVGVLLVLGSTAVAPFIYTLF
jgi:Family of unknown function (DUF5989)